jgi:hypothetical protein
LQYVLKQVDASNTCFVSPPANRDCSILSQGAGVRFVYNLNRFVAIDSEWSFSPEGTGTGTNQWGGRTQQALFGVKAGWHGRRFGFFGRLAPGLLSYGHAVNGVQNGTTQLTYGRLTDFQAYGGVAVEYYPSRHVALRYDAGQTYTNYRANNVQPQGYSFLNIDESQRSGQMAMAILYRF